MTDFIGKSKASLRLLAQLEALKKQNVDVLLLGEIGTGRDFCVEYLSQNSFLKIDAEFLDLSIQSLDSEVINLYIDGLERLPGPQQIEIIQLLEKRSFRNKQEVKGRVFYSASPKIFERIQKGEFRDDIFQKLFAIRIEIPDLNERREDISLFIHSFIQKYNAKYKKKVEFLSEKLESFLLSYQWKGNLGQLESFLENQILFSKGKTLDKRGLKLDAMESSIEQTNLEIKPGISLAEYEKAIIEANLIHFQGNRLKASRAMGISERHLYRKIKELGLNL